MNQRYSYYLLLVLIIMGFQVLFTFQQTYAQEPTPSPSPVITPTLLEAGNASLQPITPVLTSTSSLPSGKSGVVQLALGDLGEKDVTLSAPFSQTNFDLFLPSYWNKLPGSSLILNYIFNLGTNNGNEVAELRLDINNELIYKTILISSDKEQQLNIPLPDEWPGSSSTRERFTITITMNSECGQDGNFLKSVTILSKSLLILNYQVQPVQFDLALYPSPIYERAFFTSTSHIVLPSIPTQRQMDGALSMIAGLGSLTGNNLIISATTDSAWDSAKFNNNHVILVGSPDSNTLISELNKISPLLPALLTPRRLQLSTHGYNAIIPGTPVTYTVYITNNEAIPATNLTLNTQLSPLAEQIECQAQCNVKKGTVSWNVQNLPPSTAATYTVTFTLPLTMPKNDIDVVSELRQNQGVINVSTLPTLVTSELTPVLTHTMPVSRFFFVANGRAVPEFDGIIQLFPSPWQADKAILMVTGLTDEAVYKAGRALGNKAYFPGMRGQIALVKEVLDNSSAAPQPEINSLLTLTDLGYEDKTIYGVTKNVTTYEFPLPSSWLLTSEAKVRFLFSHSAILDPTRSSLTLLFNDTPIGSSLLDDKNITNGELVASIPFKEAKPGQINTLSVITELHLLDPCADTESTQSWINLHADSSLSLPYVANENKPGQFNLGLLLNPFINNPNLTDLLVSLPEQPTSEEYTAAAQIVAHMGDTGAGDNFNPITLLGSPNNINLASYHIVTIGRPSRNPLLQSVNEALPQPFVPGTDLIQQKIDEIIFRLPDGLDLGYLQILSSAWDSEKAILAVTGTGDAGMRKAAQLLADSTRLWQVKGNLALFRDDQIFTIDTRTLTKEGGMTAISTIVPELVVLGTATPTKPAPTVTPVASATIQTPIVQTSVAQPPDAPSLDNKQGLPIWVPFTVGGGVILIIIILSVAYWQPRRGNQ